MASRKMCFGILMFKMLKLIVVAICMFLPWCNGYKSAGPPQSACNSILPEHGAGLRIYSPTQSWNKYRIVCDKTTYQYGDEIQVNVFPNADAAEEYSGDVTYAGLMAQARGVSFFNKPVQLYGKFKQLSYLTPVRFMNCFGQADDTVVHASTGDMYNASLVWKALPTDCDDIHFYATVVRTKTNVYQVKSPKITYIGGSNCGITTTSTTTTTPATTTTTPATTTTTTTTPATTTTTTTTPAPTTTTTPATTTNSFLTWMFSTTTTPSTPNPDDLENIDLNDLMNNASQVDMMQNSASINSGFQIITATVTFIVINSFCIL